jgi:hypothetical protein
MEPGHPWNPGVDTAYSRLRFSKSRRPERNVFAMPRHLSRHQYLRTANGRRLAYRSGGPPDGTPVVLLHGMAGRSDTWNEVAGALINAGRG